MRLWHQDLLARLPDKQLLGQHRECCALRGLGWGKKHSVVDYVFKHPYWKLFKYHSYVIKEMECRGFNVTSAWKDHTFRGKRVGIDRSDFTNECAVDVGKVYSEHDDRYLMECVKNLNRKGAKLKDE